ncbi:anti-ECFsigma factor, ChrR [Cladochytrium replicatum]|nr:anti-ECFsigma factor, ChrR [Cladochytrium replicatum]
MLIRPEYSLPAFQRFADLEFVPSPMPGVHRGMLDRVGNEVARVTTLVRYDPNRSFSQHTHTKGEEFLVLEGTFNDKHATYPTGTYIRNPVGSEHAPFVKEDGCLIYVKLRWMDPSEPFVRADVAHFVEAVTETVVQTLYVSKVCEERVYAISVPAAQRFVASDEEMVKSAEIGGAELFVVCGEALVVGGDKFMDGERVLKKWDWLRLPFNPDTLRQLEFQSGDEGVSLFVKVGHLKRYDNTEP